MERLAGRVVARPWLVIVLLLGLTAALGAQLRHIRLDSRARDQVPSDDPHGAIEDLLTQRFGTGKRAVVALEVASGDIFTVRTLERLQRITRDIARIPGVEPSTVYSLASEETKLLQPEDGALRVETALASIPTDDAGLRALRDAVFRHPMYVGNLVTADARGAIVLADFRDGVRADQIQKALEEIAAREREPGTSIYINGQQAFLEALDRNTRSALPLLLLAIVVIGGIHYEAFRTWQAVALPLVTAILSTIWGMGLIAFLGFRFDAWTAVTAILILSVAAGHAVQILKRYYECYQTYGDNRRAVVAALTSVGPAMLTAGSVAALGFASLATTHTVAVRNFGLTAAFGILSALLIELTFIPACRVLLPPPRAHETSRERSHRLLDRALERVASIVERRPGATLVTAAVLLGTAAFGVRWLVVNNTMETWLSPQDPFFESHRLFNDRFGGVMTIDIPIVGRERDAILDPEVLAAIDALEAVIAAEPAIGATLSITDFLKVMNQAMHDGDPVFYRVPESRNLAAQYLLLYSPEVLAKFLTSDNTTAVIRARSRADNVAWAQSFFARLRRVAAERFPPDVSVGVAGGRLADQVSMNVAVVRDKLRNMAQVSAVIFVLSALALRSIVAGLLVLAPVLSAAVVTLGLMGWFGSWLTFATASYTALGISLGADFAIYLLFRLRDELRGRDLRPAVRETLITSGKAILFVSTAIAAGYAVLLTSGFPLWRQLGLYVALMMAVSALATLTVLPAMVLVGAPKFLRRTAEAPEPRSPPIAVAEDRPAR